MVPRKKRPFERAFEELGRRAELLLEHVHEDWKNLKRVRPIAVTWVSEPVSDDKGMQLEDAVLCLLPEDEERHQRVLTGMVERTKAAALLLIRQRGDVVTATFETPIGSTRWNYKIEDRVDRKVLVLAGVEKDVPATGLLWHQLAGG